MSAGLAEVLTIVGVFVLGVIVGVACLIAAVLGDVRRLGRSYQSAGSTGPQRAGRRLTSLGVRDEWPPPKS
jgi:hypothetical protein